MEQQRTEEWFEKRKGRVTGSRFGAAIGLSPYAKPSDVMREMVRDYHGAEREFQGNIATQWGSNHEQVATVDFEMETGLSVQETGFHCYEDWSGASPDGLIGDDATIEIKCPFGARESGEFKSIYDQPHYYAQIQLELLSTGRKRCYFYQWSPVATMLEIVDFSQAWIDGNLPKARQFYEKYLKEVESPEKHLTPLVKNKEAQDLANEYSNALAEMESSKARLDSAKQALIECANGEKSNISGYLVYKTQKAGSVQYAKVVKDHLPDLDLEKYRGKPSEYWSIR